MGRPEPRPQTCFSAPRRHFAGLRSLMLRNKVPFTIGLIEDYRERPDLQSESSALQS